MTVDTIEVGGRRLAINNPAWLKLDLFCKGMRLGSGCDQEDWSGRPLLRTRAGLGSGVELILPDNLWTNVPVVESFAADSPYELRRVGSVYHLFHDDREITEVTLPDCPGWYKQTTTSGKQMDRIGTLQGTYLAIYPSAVCDYWLEEPRTNCKFCSVGLNLGHDDAEGKTLEDILEVVHAARKESGIRYVDFNTGHYIGETYLDILEPIIKRIRQETDLLIGIQTPPHSDLNRFKQLKKMGVNRVSFCFELFDQECFQKVCPGKHRQYGQTRYLDAIEYCAKLSQETSIFHPWVANGEIIAGLESPRDSIRAIDWMTERGAIPTVCVFRPLKGTDMENEPPPDSEQLLPVFSRLYDACMDHNLPIGLAPNIHVSLVLLPDECWHISEHQDQYHRMEMMRRRKAKVVKALYGATRIWHNLTH